ncbi:stage V sporulation protein AD [Siminovitchia sp. FSL H7-0308]|uniref:Stage V sporulation protein AD n=1 Tax=Siminovitchia thermophila TaxID=1245522 RepID=A0ABS2RCF0_9BACI|nr:stage V sporulation protein AD [Siminovitchia thermophila]MBM7717341.1 stage V sporulation protein AD [Siminovitchia thermophila]ONK24384.1 stage V sporulation protein AD [Bacillus sp. VT-16-64]
MLTGAQTWVFKTKPAIISTGTVGGPFEKDGRLAKDFDKFHQDLWMGKDSYEKAQTVLLEDAVDIALRKKALKEDAIQFFLAGDLINQITPTSFAARKNQIPHLGLFSACATATQGLALSAMILDNDGANYILTGASSHNASAERQFRYPTEYGGQKPPTAQWTVTGAGVALLSKGQGLNSPHPRIVSATIGKVVDMGLTDPYNMGGAMAPAAVDTITRHLFDLNIDPSYYDLILTGDLAKIGRAAALDLLHQQGLKMKEEQFLDCGLMIYSEEQEVFAGASGPACAAVVTYGHILNEMSKGTYKKVLFVATGALLSPLSYQQKETIPCIAHAVGIECM